MKRICALAAASLLGVVSLQYSGPARSQPEGGWLTLLEGQSMGDWDKVGDANWIAVDDGVTANQLIGKDPAYLVSKTSHKDFEILVEFWADEDANSGIFIRCDTPKVIDSKACYEVNIFDKRPDPTGGTGAIVDVTKVDPMPKAADKWNTYEITAQGSHLVVKLNGEKTADVEDSKHAEGPIALQYGAGTIKFRKVQIKPL